MEEKPDILREKWACWAAEVSVTATSSVNPARMASLANFSGSLLIWTTCLCLPISQTYNNKIWTNSQPMAAQNISQYTQKTALLILYDNSYPHKPNYHRISRTRNAKSWCISSVFPCTHSRHVAVPTFCSGETTLVGQAPWKKDKKCASALLAIAISQCCFIGSSSFVGCSWYQYLRHRSMQNLKTMVNVPSYGGNRLWWPTNSVLGLCTSRRALNMA